MDEEDKEELHRVRGHAIALELELARYAATYGLTDEARRLLKESPLAIVEPKPEDPASC